MRKFAAFAAVAALVLSGCGKKSDTGSGASGSSAAAGSPSASVVGLWKSDREGMHKILMAKLQRETPNMPYEEMERQIAKTTADATDGLTVDFREGGVAHFHQGEHDGDGTWKMNGQSIELKGPNRPEPATGTIADGIMTFKHGDDHVDMVLIKG